LPRRPPGFDEHGTPARAARYFENLLARVLEGEIDLAGGVLLHACGYADAAGVGQAFEPNCDIYSIPKMSPSSTTMSPTLIPILRSRRLSVPISTFRSSICA